MSKISEPLVDIRAPLSQHSLEGVRCFEFLATEELVSE